jgi:hypothetical protein
MEWASLHIITLIHTYVSPFLHGRLSGCVNNMYASVYKERNCVIAKLELFSPLTFANNLCTQFTTNPPTLYITIHSLPASNTIHTECCDRCALNGLTAFLTLDM